MKKAIYILPFIVLLAVFAYFMLGSKKVNKEVVSEANYENWQKTKLSVNNKIFTLSYPNYCNSIHRDTLAWTAKMPKDQMQGVLVTFMEKDKEISMASPFIQVAYFSKKNPGCSTIDSVLLNLNQLMKNNPYAKVTKPQFTLPSVASRPVYCEHIHIDRRMVNGQEFHEQYYAYAYMEHSPEYWITMTLCCASRTEFEEWEQQFYRVISSYKD